MGKKVTKKVVRRPATADPSSAKLRLASLGDSITQGFMSGSIFRTQDTLLRSPPKLWDDVLEAGERTRRCGI